MPSSIGHTLARRLIPGRRFLGALLLLRVLDCAVGCGPDPGELGGECKSTGCSLTCDGDLVCDTGRNLCVRPTPGAINSPSGQRTGDPSSFCALVLDDTECGDDQNAYDCTAGRQPTGRCTRSPVSARMCCPRMVVSSSCRTESETPCAAPATSFACMSGAPRGPYGDQLDCAKVILDRRSASTGYCCATTPSCFRVEATVDSAVVCSDESSTQLICGGGALPAPDAGCLPAALQYSPAGTQVRGFCCSRPPPDASAE